MSIGSLFCCSSKRPKYKYTLSAEQIIQDRYRDIDEAPDVRSVIELLRTFNEGISRNTTDLGCLGRLRLLRELGSIAQSGREKIEQLNPTRLVLGQELEVLSDYPKLWPHFLELNQKLRAEVGQHRPCHGFIYKITNAQNVDSYLIGTCHLTPQTTAENNLFFDVLDRCQELVTEIGPDVSEQEKASNLLRQRNYPHSYCLDLALTQAALQKGTPVAALDNPNEYPALWQEAMEEWLRDFGVPDAIRSKIPTWSQHFSENCHEIVSVIAFQDGLEDIFGEEVKLIESEMRSTRRENQLLAQHKQEGKPELSSEAFTRIIKAAAMDFGLLRRNQKWNATLIKKITETNTPVCIAVGALHIFGQDGLLAAFRKQNLAVTKISATAEDTRMQSINPINPGDARDLAFH